MSSVLIPDDEAEIAEIVSAAKSNNTPLHIVGGGTRTGLGRTVKAQKLLSLKELSGISLYEPGALTIVAKAGTPLADIEQALAKENQRLAFEPMDHRPLFGSKGEPTIGGVVGGNISGPRRMISGACRDSLIGVRFINGRGKIIKNGGRVMKNVTGLDLVKLMAGSYGTLGVFSELSFKVMPTNERQATLVVFGLDIATAIKTLSVALGSPFEVSGATFIPHQDENGDASKTLLRVEGFDSQVSYRLERLKELVQKTIASTSSEIEIIEGDDHISLWQGIRDVKIFSGTKHQVFKLNIKPLDAIAISEAISAEMSTKNLDTKTLYDWGGGLIWLGIEDNEQGQDKVGQSANSHVQTIRSIVNEYGGHVTLVRAPKDVREAVSPFHPEHQIVAKLSSCLRKKFDPAGILNPGRLGADPLSAIAGGK